MDTIPYILPTSSGLKSIVADDLNNIIFLLIGLYMLYKYGYNMLTV